jgi:uncharacterized phage infection (PIP) family protein YhgE
MRRSLFIVLGALEMFVAVLLIQLGREFPDNREVEESFQSAGRVTDRAGYQVHLLQQQVQNIERLELNGLARRLQKQTHAVTSTLREQAIDFNTVRTLRDALGDVARGLNSLSETLDPQGIGRLSTGLGETATFLDEKVIPAAQQAAEHLDKSTAALEADARHLSALLKNTPVDLKAVREVHDSLTGFQEGLKKVNDLFKVQRLETMREGFHGLESSLTTGSEQVERLADYSYPVVRFNGFRPEISQRPFWPEGNKIADGMRKAAAGATAAGKEMDELSADLPRIRASLTESCTLIEKVRQGLGTALEHRDSVEPILKELPTHAARLADDLPRIGSDLARMLRDTRKLKDVASSMRQAQKGIDTAVARWPEMRTTLARLAVVLSATREQLNHAVHHRKEYEAAMHESVQIADTFAALLPLVTDQLDGRLEEEDQTLSELGESLDEVSSALPAYERATKRLLHTGRLLAWLVSAIVGLHGCYLVLSVRIGRRYSF